MRVRFLPTPPPFTRSYDELGRVVADAINGAANNTGMGYDALGRLTSASSPLGAFTYNYVRATGRLDTVQLPNGQSTQFQYFANAGDQRLQQIKHVGTGGSVISQFDYAYNAVGEMATWTLNNSGLAQAQQYTFGYDAGDQLKAAVLKDTGAGTVVKDFGYRYDGAGNRVGSQGSNAIVTEQANGLNQVTQSSGGGLMRFAGTVSKPATVTVGGAPTAVDAAGSYEGYAQVNAGATTRVHVVATDSSGNVSDRYTDITPEIGVRRQFLTDC